MNSDQNTSPGAVEYISHSPCILDSVSLRTDTPPQAISSEKTTPQARPRQNRHLGPAKGRERQAAVRLRRRQTVRSAPIPSRRHPPGPKKVARQPIGGAGEHLAVAIRRARGHRMFRDLAHAISASLTSRTGQLSPAGMTRTLTPPPTSACEATSSSAAASPSGSSNARAGDRTLGGLTEAGRAAATELAAHMASFRAAMLSRMDRPRRRGSGCHHYLLLRSITAGLSRGRLGRGQM